MNFSAIKVLHVARQEVWSIVFTKGFVFMLLVPLFFLFLMSGFIPLIERFMETAKTNRTDSVRIGVIGGDPGLVEDWRSRIQDKKLANGLPLFIFTSLPVLGIAEDDQLKAAQKRVRNHELDAIAVIRGDLTSEGRCEFYFMRGFNIELPSDLRWPLNAIVNDLRFKNAGYDPATISALSRGITWNEFEIPLESSPEAGSEQKHEANFDKLFAPAIVSVLVMFFLVFTTSQRMLRGIVEEKTSRVVEILLSSVTPNELLAGKVFGFFLIGMIQFALWLGVGLATMAAKQIPITEYVQPIYFLQFFIFLSAGYLFYAACFATIGAIVSDETESQSLQGIITMFIVLPLMLNIVFISQPMWWPVRLLSFIPFLSPTVMAIRMVAAQIPWWEITAVALTLILSSIIATILAARIFRVGILMTGKRPSFRELGRWCFYQDTKGVQEISTGIESKP